MYYPEFKNMAEIHQEGESETGRYKIQHVEVPEPDIFEKLQNPEYAGQKDQTICVLKDTQKREIIMSDSWMEQETNIDVVRNAKGHVLIAGLGIGMIVLALQEMEAVESITVVEICPELTAFTGANLDLYDKVEIVISDIHDFKSDKIFDTVYCDIWNDVSADNLDEMDALTEKFGWETKHWRYDTTVELYEEDYYA